MKVTLLGISSKYSFEGSRGEVISGRSLYIGRPFDDGQGDGLKVTKAFFPESRLSFSPNPGQCVDIQYDERGKPYSLAPVDEDMDIEINLEV